PLWPHGRRVRTCALLGSRSAAPHWRTSSSALPPTTCPNCEHGPGPAAPIRREHGHHRCPLATEFPAPLQSVIRGLRPTDTETDPYRVRPLLPLPRRSVRCGHPGRLRPAG